MKIGEVLRYSNKSAADPTIEFQDGVLNYYWATDSAPHSKALIEKGVNPIGWSGQSSIPWRPAILVRSSPHKIGSETTPWQDYFDTDFGHVRYYGDNKKAGHDPTQPLGNSALLQQYDLYTSPSEEKRKHAAPLLFFRGVPHHGKAKGFIRFEGFGIIDRVSRVTQHNRTEGNTFTNYAFDCTLFDLSQESETFDWRWITSRRESSKPVSESLKLAPASWQKWVKGGEAVLGSCRRRVSKVLVTTRAEQVPKSGSRTEQCLLKIYDYFSHESKKHHFEALAERVAAFVIDPEGHRYRRGWITQASTDGGADFIARLDVGSGFGAAKLVVLGQAKCEKPTTATGGNHIARTVARLKRGWVGVYVTTGYFSEHVQREVIEDAYPLLLINGSQVAKAVISMVHSGGFSSTEEFLAQVANDYINRLRARKPEEILLDLA